MKRFWFRKGRLTLHFSMLLLILLFCAGPSTHAGQNAVEIESAKIWVGKKARSFILPGIDGRPVDLSKNLGKRPVVLVFYRGVW